MDTRRYCSGMLLLLSVVVAALTAGLTAAASSRCYPPSRVPSAPLTSEEDAIVMGTCYSTCVEKYASTAVPQVHAPYSSVGVLKLELNENCDTVQKVLECQLGCIIKANNPEVNRSICRSECWEPCLRECGGSGKCNATYKGSTCPRQCQKTACTAGCNLYSRERDGTKLPSLPTNPQDFEADSEGFYHVTVNSTDSGNEWNLNVTAFIFKITELSTTDTTYAILYGTSDLLDLGFFSCKKVNISVAAVNAYGISAYSTSTALTVQGEERYPTQPSNISYTWEGDDRTNYNQNAVVTISWQKPEDFELIREYKLTILIQGDGCGPNSNSEQHGILLYSFNKHAMTFIWRADFPQDAPVLDCRYQITLQAFPWPAEHAKLDPDIVVDLSSYTHYSGVPPSMELDCARDVNKTTGNITVFFGWKVSGFTTNGRPIDEAIESYNLYVTLNDIDVLERVIFMERLLSKDNGTYRYAVPYIKPFDNKDYIIKVTVTPAATDNINVPGTKVCFVSAAPEPPEAIEGDTVTVIDFDVDKRFLFLKLSWEQPNATYGNVSQYEVRIAREPLPQQNGPNMDYAVAYTGALSIMNGFGIVETNKIYLSDDTYCLYAQIRLENNYFWSNWSDPVMLLRYPEKNPNCTVNTSNDYHLTTNVPSTTALVEPEQKIPFYTYIVAGGGVCIIIFLVFAVVMGCILCKKHRMRKEFEGVFTEDYPNPMFQGSSFISKASYRRSSLSIKTSQGLRPDEWEIPQSNIIVEEQLGEGCFGEVHRGIVKGPLPNSRMLKNTICVTVAVKFLKPSASGGERTDFLNEIDTMKEVANGNNSHVVNLIGCVTVQEPLCLITEYIKHGDLLSYLQTIRKLVTRKNRKVNLARITGMIKPEPYLEPHNQQQPRVPEGDKAIVPDPSSSYAELGEVEPVNLISFAYQIASGMEYLSSLNIVHRDLACRNILVGEGKNLKISDFGMSRVVACDDVYVKTTKGRLPWKWMAIESIVNREFTTASDVWSYGVTLWEIATLGGFPYPMISNSELLDHVMKGNRLECPENCSTLIYEIMLDCWLEDPTQRPTFTALRSKFDAMLAEDNPYIQFDNINIHKPYYHRDTSSDSDDTKTESISGSAENGMDSYTSSSVTLSGTGANAYNTLSPITDEVASSIEESLKRPVPNMYVETPSKPYDSMFDLDSAGMEQIVEADCESCCSSSSCGTDLCETAV